MDFSSIIAEDPWRFLALATRKPFLTPLNAMDPGRSAVQAFIEAKERELQANKMSADNRAKNDVIKSIMDELERETADENN